MGCGIAGCIGENASFFVYNSLIQLQHRGEDATKILSFDNTHHEYGDLGHVTEVFKKENLEMLKGNYAIGHVRYPTIGVYNDPKEKLKDAPPIWTENPCFFALCHNGDMPKTKYETLRKKLYDEGFYFKTNSELEIIEKFLSKGLRKNIKNYNFNNKDIFKSVKYMMERVPAAYSAIMLMTPKDERKLIGFADPQKIRPLVFGKNSKLYLFASETAAIDVLSNYLNEKFETFELQGGEVVIAEEGKEPLKRRLIEVEPKHCFFEYTYFARPDSVENGVSVREVRYRLGHELGRKNKTKADLVTATPKSGKIYNEGFSAATGIPSIQIWYRNDYVGRAFIRPPEIREEISKIKLNPIRHLVEGKRIITTEDSIVRGTNSKNNNESLRNYGAIEIHGKTGTPRLVNPCEFGIDMKDPNTLVARGKTEEEIAKLSGYDSLSYINVDELVEAIGLPKNQLCLHCIGDHGPKFNYIISPNDPRF
jgi:amidophosphoribosyltransferase